MIAIPFLFLAFLGPYLVMGYYYSEDRVEPGPLGPLACRVGITTDPVERNAYWESQYPGLNGWEVLTTHGSKSAAESAEGTAARIRGCLPHAGGPDGEGSTWYVFYFHKGGPSRTASGGP